MYDGFLGGFVRRYGWRKFQIAFWILTAIGMLLFIPVFISPSVTRTFWGGVTAYTGMLLFCLGLAGTIIIPNRRRRYTVFETALAHPSELDPFVEDQSTPDIAALQLPANIDLVTRKPLALAATGLLWLCLLAALLMTHYFWLLILYAPFIINPIWAFVRRRDIAIQTDDQKISVSEDVMAVSSDRTKHGAIAWDDVRVFALIQQAPNGARVYMLSSGNTEIRWKHRLRTHWYSLATPTTSDEAYSQQMEALLSYAAARTELLLLDLR